MSFYGYPRRPPTSDDHWPKTGQGSKIWERDGRFPKIYELMPKAEFFWTKLGVGYPGKIISRVPKQEKRGKNSKLHVNETGIQTSVTLKIFFV